MNKILIFLIMAIFSYDAYSEEKPAIVLLKNSKGNLSFKVALRTEGKVKVDWGNGNVQSYDANVATRLEEATTIMEEANKNVAIKIYGDIRLFSCVDQFIYSLDVRNAEELSMLNCSKNYLTQIDLSNNKGLRTFNCSDNRIKSLDFSKNKRITYLTASYNYLRDINLKNNTALIHLNVSDNHLRNLNLSENKSLKQLSLSGNKLSDIETKHIAGLVHLDISYNKFSPCGLNKVFSEIPVNTKEEKSEKKNLIIFNNRGFVKSNTAIAVQKNWKPDADGTGKAKCK